MAKARKKLATEEEMLAAVDKHWATESLRQEMRDGTLEIVLEDSWGKPMTVVYLVFDGKRVRREALSASDLGKSAKKFEDSLRFILTCGFPGAGKSAHLEDDELLKWVAENGWSQKSSYKGRSFLAKDRSQAFADMAAECLRPDVMALAKRMETALREKLESCGTTADIKRDAARKDRVMWAGQVARQVDEVRKSVKGCGMSKEQFLRACEAEGLEFGEGMAEDELHEALGERAVKAVHAA